MKLISTGQQAREKLKRGIDLACNAIKITLGPSGRNAVLGRVDIPPIITNDGVSVARNVEAADELENQGVWIVKEACSVASNKAGDGTTTTAVLLQAIVSKLFDMLKDNGSLVSKKINVMELMRKVDKDCEEIISKLNPRQINEEEIYNVAKSAGEFDWLASIVSDIYKKVGKDGYVTIKEGFKTSYETYKGIELQASYPSEYFITKDRVCELEAPRVLVSNQPLDANAVAPMVLDAVAKGVKSLVLIAPDFSKDLLNRLITTKLNSGFSAVALKVQTFDKDDLLIDIATLTKAKFLDKNTYTKTEDFIADVKVENLGTIEKAVIGDGSSILIGGEGDCMERVALLKTQMETTESVFDRDNLEKRIAYLSGGIATLTIGGESDFEKGYFKLKAENAVNAVSQALKYGVIKGGGLELKEIGDSLVDNILADCIKQPYNQIQENAGGLEITDSVIDPVGVTISALKSACSLAGRVLTTEVVIAFKNDDTNTKD